MKIKPLHKRLIMGWKIIAHNGIVKFMQFPETKEAGGEPRERVEGASSYDEKFCRRFVSFVSTRLTADSTKQTNCPFLMKVGSIKCRSLPFEALVSLSE